MFQWESASIEIRKLIQFSFKPLRRMASVIAWVTSLDVAELPPFWMPTFACAMATALLVPSPQNRTYIEELSMRVRSRVAEKVYTPQRRYPLEYQEPPRPLLQPCADLQRRDGR